MVEKASTSKLSRDEAHSVLSLAALFEGNFSVDWLVDSTEMKVSQVLFAVEKGLLKGFLIKKGPGVFRFADLEKRQRLLDSVTPDKKKMLHRRIADAILREIPDDSNILALSHHLCKISNDVESCQWMLKAGDVYLKSYRHAEALECYGKALEDLSGLFEEKADCLFTQTAIKYSEISTANQDTAQVVSILQEAMARAKELNKKHIEALLEMQLAKNEWLRSRYPKALKHFEKGWSIAKELNDNKLLRRANTFTTFFLYWQGRFQEAVHNYEKFLPDIEKYPRQYFPLLAGIMVGYCYALTGQVSQGLGMMDTIMNHCQERGNLYLAAHAAYSIGAVMLDIRHIESAIQYLERSLEEATQAQTEWVKIRAMAMLAFGYYLDGNNKKSIAYLQEYLQHSRKVKVTVLPYSCWMELCWAMERGKLPHIRGLSLEKEVDRMIRGSNIFMKGIAYRFRALLERRKGLPHERIIDSLNQSQKWLVESGHQIELARAKLELAREYVPIGDEEKAKETTRIASKILTSFNEELLPDDLRSLIKEKPSGENLLRDILKLGQEVVTVRNNRDVAQHIISTANRITGAERGAIFLLEDDTDRPHKLRLRASKNLPLSDVTHPNFGYSMKLIEEVALKGKGRILSSLSNQNIRSCICVPMILRDKLVGVLYHDNHLLNSAFKQSDMELLAYFAGQAAFALDNAKAYEEIKRLNQKLSEEKLYYEKENLQNLHFDEIVGEGHAIKKVLAQVDQVAKSDTTVLILGETGAGKELIARAIHRHGPRCERPFIRVHCSALPENLITSELFGHERGAFTGATHRRIGRFELADGGTLFLDEIGDLTMDIQVRLLRVLESKEFERVGGSETLHSDFRLLAATNCDLEQLVKERKFRADLYYRLNVFPVHVPPLRERKEDILALTHYFLNVYAKKMGKTFSRIPEQERDKLLHYNWPGNIRELENIIERSTILSPDSTFHVPELVITSTEFPYTRAETTLKENERRHILWALHKTNWKVRGQGGAAELLDIHPSTLTFRMKKLSIQRK